MTASPTCLLYNDTDYPLTDTTINNSYGHFLWAASDFQPHCIDQSLYLYSDTLWAYQYQNRACLTFNYFLIGSLSLKVYSRAWLVDQNSSLLWSIDNDPDDQRL